MRMLVCEVEKHMLRLAQVNLERQGYEVVAVDNGEKAIELIHERPFDLAWIFNCLPAVDGYAILKAIRTHDHGTHTRVVLAFDDASVMEEWKKLPYQADRYVARTDRIELPK